MTDQSRLSIQAVQYPEDAPLRRGAPPENLSHAFRFQIGTNQAIWTTSADVQSSQLPDGAVHIDAPLAKDGLPTIKITPGITTGSHNISGGTYYFLDDKDAFGIWLNDKSVNGLSLFNRYMEQYDFEQGESIKTEEDLERALRYTFQIKDTITLDRKVYGVKCEDINRDLDVDLFVERSWRLEDTIPEGKNVIIGTTLDASLPNVLTDNDHSWLHGTDYHVHPGQQCGIALIEQGDEYEFFSYKGLRDDVLTVGGRTIVTFDLIDRGLFGTEPRRWEVSNSTPRENRLKIVAVPYAEEDPMSLLLAVTIGKTLDGRAFPYNAGIDERWINRNSIVAASSDRRRTLRGQSKISLKKFMEEQILSKMPGVLTPGPDGAMAFKAIPFEQTVDTQGTVDEDTCYGRDIGDLTHDAKDTASFLQLLWDKHPVTGVYQQATQWVDDTAVAETLADEPAVLESSLITTGRSTESEVQALGSLLYSRYARPVKRLPVNPGRSLWHLEACDSVRVNHRVKDYASQTPGYTGIDIPMMIASVNHDQNRQRYSWDLIGYRKAPASIAQGGEALPDEEYSDGALPLPGVSGSVATGSPTILLGQKYFHIGAITLQFTPIFVGQGDFIFWNKGVVSWSSQIDLSGKGGVGGSGSVEAGLAGERGYSPAHPATGSVSVSVRRFENSSGDPQGITDRTIRSRPPSRHTSFSGTLPTAPTVENGRIVNMPVTLQGAGGHGGDGSTYRGFTEDGDVVSSDAATIAGSDGGNGGGGCQLVCDPGSSFTGTGSLTLSGEDSATPTAKNSTYGASGSGGAHGFFAVFHPFAGTAFPVNSGNLIASRGRSTLIGERANGLVYKDKGPWLDARRSHYGDQRFAENEWQTAHRVVFLPGTQEVLDTIYLNSIDRAFANQRDNKIVLIPNSGSLPTDGNPGDMTLSVTDLANKNNLAPDSAYVMDNAFEWQVFDWVADTRRTAYLNLLQSNRTNGGLEFFNQENRPVNFTPGALWRQPSSGITWTLERFGPPDSLAYVDDAQVSDNRFVDPEFTDLLMGGTAWVIRSDIYSLPQFALSAATVALSATIVGVEVTGGARLSTSSQYELPAVPNVSAVVYSDTSAEVIFSTPADMAGITGFEIRRNGALITTVSAAGPYSYVDSSLSPSTSYAYVVRAVGDSGARGPDSAQFQITTDATTSVNNDLNPITGLTHSVYSTTAIELFWSPPQQPGTATGYEIYRDGTLVSSINGVQSNSYFESSLIPGTTYVYSIRVVSSTQRSDDVSQSVTTNNA